MANKIVKLKDGNDYLYPYANFMGIDYARTIATYNSENGEMYDVTYTATEDCWAYFRGLNGWGGFTSPAGYSWWESGGFVGGQGRYIYLPLKKGQKVYGHGYYKLIIYGVKY